MFFKRKHGETQWVSRANSNEKHGFCYSFSSFFPIHFNCMSALFLFFDKWFVHPSTIVVNFVEKKVLIFSGTFVRHLNIILNRKQNNSNEVCHLYWPSRIRTSSWFNNSQKPYTFFYCKNLISTILNVKKFTCYWVQFDKKTAVFRRLICCEI